jgi:hypothetical protein
MAVVAVAVAAGGRRDTGIDGTAVDVVAAARGATASGRRSAVACGNGVCRAVSRGVGVTSAATEGAAAHAVARVGASWRSEVAISSGGQRYVARVRRAAIIGVGVANAPTFVAGSAVVASSETVLVSKGCLGFLLPPGEDAMHGGGGVQLLGGVGVRSVRWRGEWLCGIRCGTRGEGDAAAGQYAYGVVQ